MVTLATYSRHSSWWQTDHTPDPRAMSAYPQLLGRAERICEYQPIGVPALLQTPAYARIHLAEAVTDPDLLDQRVAARLHQARLITRTEPDPPRLAVVLDEAVLRQLPHRLDIMAEQLCHLAALGELPNVSIRIVPITAGSHPGLLAASGFTVLDFPQHHGPAPIRPPAFTEAGGPDAPTDTRQYRAAFNDLLALALDEDATHDLLLATAGKYQLAGHWTMGHGLAWPPERPRPATP